MLGRPCNTRDLKASIDTRQDFASTKADPEVRIFSPVKYRIMLVLKKEEQADLETLSRKLSISQMAVYKHVRELENKGLVEHTVRRIGVGRPRLVFRPAAKSSGVYPSAYSELAIAALGTLDEAVAQARLAIVRAVVARCRGFSYLPLTSFGRPREPTQFLDRAQADAIGFAKGAVNCPCLGHTHFGAADQRRDVRWVGIAETEKTS
jgi:DNA-binding transcriptional ArsR family regulator